MRIGNPKNEGGTSLMTGISLVSDGSVVCSDIVAVRNGDNVSIVSASSGVMSFSVNLSPLSNAVGSKLNKPSSNGFANQILATNGDGTTKWINNEVGNVEWSQIDGKTSLVNALPSNVGSNNQFMKASNGNVVWASFDGTVRADSNNPPTGSAVNVFVVSHTRDSRIHVPSTANVANGKVLKVSNGNTYWGDDEVGENELPVYSNVNAGQVLQVDSDGNGVKWATVSGGDMMIASFVNGNGVVASAVSAGHVAASGVVGVVSSANFAVRLASTVKIGDVDFDGTNNVTIGDLGFANINHSHSTDIWFTNALDSKITAPSTDGNGGKVLALNSEANGYEWIDVLVASGAESAVSAESAVWADSAGCAVSDKDGNDITTAYQSRIDANNMLDGSLISNAVSSALNVHDGVVTIRLNGSGIGSFSMNQSTDSSISIPVATSDAYGVVKVEEVVSNTVNAVANKVVYSMGEMLDSHVSSVLVHVPSISGVNNGQVLKVVSGAVSWANDAMADASGVLPQYGSADDGKVLKVVNNGADVGWAYANVGDMTIDSFVNGNGVVKSAINADSAGTLANGISINGVSLNGGSSVTLAELSIASAIHSHGIADISNLEATVSGIASTVASANTVNVMVSGVVVSSLVAGTNVVFATNDGTVTIAAVGGGGGSIDIDSTIESDGVNAVAGSAIYSGLAKKIDVEDLAQVAFTGLYSDLVGIPVTHSHATSDITDFNAVVGSMVSNVVSEYVHDATITFTSSGVVIGSFTVNQATSSTIEICLSAQQGGGSQVAFALSNGTDDLAVLNGDWVDSGEVCEGNPIYTHEHGNSTYYMMVKTCDGTQYWVATDSDVSGENWNGGGALYSRGNPVFGVGQGRIEDRAMIYATYDSTINISQHVFSAGTDFSSCTVPTFTTSESSSSSSSSESESSSSSESGGSGLIASDGTVDFENLNGSWTEAGTTTVQGMTAPYYSKTVGNNTYYLTRVFSNNDEVIVWVITDNDISTSATSWMPSISDASKAYAFSDGLTPVGLSFSTGNAYGIAPTFSNAGDGSPVLSASPRLYSNSHKSVEFFGGGDCTATWNDDALIVEHSLDCIPFVMAYDTIGLVLRPVVQYLTNSSFKMDFSDCGTGYGNVTCVLTSGFHDSKFDSVEK